MNSIQSDKRLKDLKEAFIFLLKLIAIWLSWKVIVYITGEESIPIEDRLIPALSEPWEKLNNGMRWLVLNGSEGLLNIIGYETENTGYALRLKGQRGIGLGNYCLGFQLMYYFAMLILVSGLKKSRKLVAILIGIPIVITLNIFRLAALCFVTVYYHDLMKLSHEYIFNGIVMGVLMVCYFFLIRSNKR